MVPVFNRVPLSALIASKVRSVPEAWERSSARSTPVSIARWRSRLSRSTSRFKPKRARFAREARAVAALSHPHICTLYDVGRDGQVDYLVMEYLAGDTLATRLTKGTLSRDVALTLCD